MDSKNWPKLESSPIALSIFQIKFDKDDSDLSSFEKCDINVDKYLPKKANNLQIDIKAGKISAGIPANLTANSKRVGFVRHSEDQKIKLVVDEESITYVSEAKYSTWNNFISEIQKYIDIYAEPLSHVGIKRLSIRFINQFSFDKFEDPTEYFNTLISSAGNSNLPYSIVKYGFQLTLDLPESNMYSIVKQNLEALPSKYKYIFDIDVICEQNLIFDKSVLFENLEKLREGRNEIFFSNITQKTIDLCNSLK